jgi:hypothetical protein
MDFSSLGLKFKLKFEISQNFELQSFELTRFYCIIIIAAEDHLSKSLYTGSIQTKEWF